MVEKRERGRRASQAGKRESERWARIDDGGMNGRKEGSVMMVMRTIWGVAVCGRGRVRP